MKPKTLTFLLLTVIVMASVACGTSSPDSSYKTDSTTSEKDRFLCEDAKQRKNILHGEQTVDDIINQMILDDGLLTKIPNPNYSEADMKARQSERQSEIDEDMEKVDLDIEKYCE